MHITRETDYAVRCVLSLSKTPGVVVVVDSIAEEMQIPKSFLAKIIQKLAKAKIVKSTRGVKGGFRLARDADEVSLLDVIEAIQGPLALNACVIDERSCSRVDICSVHPVWAEIGNSIAKRLKEYTFDRFVRAELSAKGKRKS